MRLASWTGVASAHVRVRRRDARSALSLCDGRTASLRLVLELWFGSLAVYDSSVSSWLSPCDDGGRDVPGCRLCARVGRRARHCIDGVTCRPPFGLSRIRVCFSLGAAGRGARAVWPRVGRVAVRPRGPVRRYSPLRLVRAPCRLRRPDGRPRHPRASAAALWLFRSSCMLAGTRMARSACCVGQRSHVPRLRSHNSQRRADR